MATFGVSKQVTLPTNQQNQYYQDAIKNPQNYTWGLANPALGYTVENWQPIPKTINKTMATRTLEELTYSLGNFQLPRFEYNADVNNQQRNEYNIDQYNLQQRAVQDTINNARQSGIDQTNLAANASNLKNFYETLAANTKSSREQFDKTNPNGRTVSTQSFVDPNSAEGQKYLGMLQAQSQQKGYEQRLLNDAEVGKQRQLIPLQTQSQIAVQAPKLQTEEKVADINAQVQKAIADATRAAQMYGANMNAMSSMFGSQMGALGSMFGGMSSAGSGGRYW